MFAGSHIRDQILKASDLFNRITDNIMKKNKLLAICFLAFISLAYSCNQTTIKEKEYPITTVLGESTLTGELIEMSVPSKKEVVMGIKTVSGDYALPYEIDYLLPGISIETVIYYEGDIVEITGTVSKIETSESEEYLEIDIKTIEKQKSKYPIITVLGEQTLTGKIIWVPMPPFTDPPLPGVVIGLETAYDNYVLLNDEHWLSDGTITIDNVVYSMDDEVEITGTVTRVHISETKEYLELDIKTIEKNKYPITTVIGERTLTGKIIWVPIPPITDPPLPGMVYGLETSSGNYVLNYDSWLDDETITIDNVVYTIDDEVEITGTVSKVEISESKEYLELDIKTIEKKSTEI